MDIESIPDGLKERSQWLIWDSSTDSKQPLTIDGKPASWNDPEDWATFEEAIEAAKATPGWGVGYVISSVGPHIGIDLDGCLREDGSPKNWMPSLDLFTHETYIERSPSGTGLHIYVRGSTIPEWWTDQTAGDHEGVEVYDEKFFTVTGDKLESSSSTIAEIDLTEWLVGAYENINGEPPRLGSSEVSEGDSQLQVYDVISRTSYPEDTNTAHPFHGSDTGKNFRVDKGGETFRCWRHNLTGNGDHLVGIEQGVIDCGDWENGLSKDTWKDIYEAARDAGYDIEPPAGGGPPTPPPDIQPDGSDSIVDLFKKAIKKVGLDPNRVTSRKDDGEKYYIGVEYVIDEGVGLANAQRQFRRDSDVLDGKDRRDVFIEVIWMDLNDVGEFFHTEQENVYYFYEPEHDVYPVTTPGSEINKKFRGLIEARLGIAEDRDGRTLFKKIARRAAMQSPERSVHKFGAWDDDKHELHVYDFDNGYYAIDGGTVEHRQNGEDRFFLDMRGEPFEYIEEEDRPEFEGTVPGELPPWRGVGDLLHQFVCNRINYDEHANMGPSEQRKQMYLHLHALPFLDYLSARPIMAIVGEKGSGKTVVQRSIGRFLFGKDWKESTMPDDKNDFLAIVANRPLAFIDNFDEGNEWANDTLAAVATGAGIFRRQYYTTLDLAEFSPDCFLSLTTRDPPFNRDDVADRTLVFRLARLDEFLGMGEFLRPVVEYRDTLWSSYIDNLNDIVAGLKEAELENIYVDHRMSDWAAFAKVVGDSLDLSDVDELLGAMQTERAHFAMEDSQLKPVIDRWIEPDVRGTEWTAGELLDEYGGVADDGPVEFTIGSASALGKKLSTYREELDVLYGFEVDESGAQNTYIFEDRETEQGRLR